MAGNWKCQLEWESTTVGNQTKYVPCRSAFDIEESLLVHYGTHDTSELAEWFAERFGEIAPSHRTNILDRYALPILQAWAGSSCYDEIATDGMGNGAMLFVLDDGTLWSLVWDAAGFEDAFQPTVSSREEWLEIAHRAYESEETF